MIIPAVNPVAFQLFGLPIYWYGIVMASSILVGVLVANFLFNKYNNQEKDFILSIAPILIILGIIGARLYFCLLNVSYYIQYPFQIFDIRQGGLSIHGALIAGVLALIFYSIKGRINVLKLLDSIACGTIIGQSIGRWGNYFNSEAYGLPVLGQGWGLFIPESQRLAQYVNYELFHPAFFYESVLNFLGFIILLFVLKKNAQIRVGVTFFSYLIIYSIVRFFIEQIRVDSALNICAVPIARIVSLILFFTGIVGVIAVIKISKKAR